jgi:ribosomal protein S18 acetylase RimI-like enzyme
MASYVVIRSESSGDGVQAFDPARHMREVAELVGSVFADELDPRGRGAVRDMRLAGSLSPFLGGLLSVALFNDAIAGYVWVKDGHVVGNVTLQSMDGVGLRWRISNVAVAPEYRGRGIARALMQAGIREIADRGGNWALLQVRADNDIAHRLYLNMGFTDICRDGSWSLPVLPARLPQPDPRVKFEPLHLGHGRLWLDLARAARPALAQWAEPLNPSDYTLTLEGWTGERLGRLTGLYVVERWAIWQGDVLAAALETRSNAFTGQDTMRFAVRPAARGSLEAALVARGLLSLAAHGRRPVAVQHSGDHAEGVVALAAAGFRVQRDLITMRRAISPADSRRTF